MPGFVAILSAELHFPEAGSLKGKRKHVLSAKAQLQNRFGASVAEVDHHDLWQRCALLAAFSAREAAAAEDLAERAEQWLAGQDWVLSRSEVLLVSPEEGVSVGSTELSMSGGAGSPAPGAGMSERMRRVNESVRDDRGRSARRAQGSRGSGSSPSPVSPSRPTSTTAGCSCRCSAARRSARPRMAALESARGFVQGRLARELSMKRTPQLTFEYDPSVEYGVRMTKLIDELVPDPPPDDAPDDSSAD